MRPWGHVVTALWEGLARDLERTVGIKLVRNVGQSSSFACLTAFVTVCPSK